MKRTLHRASKFILIFAIVVVPVSPSLAQSSTGSSSGSSSSAVPSGAISTGISVISGLFSGGGLNLGSLLGSLGGLLGQFGSSLGLSGSQIQVIGTVGSVLQSIVGGGGLNSGSIGGIVGAIGSIGNLSPQQQQIAQQVAGVIPSVIQAVNSGNINGILNGLATIFGILNPQQVQNTVLSPAGGLQLPSTGQTVYPIDDAVNPYGVRYAARLADKYKTDQFYKNSQIVLSEEGYERIKANLETSSSSLQQSGEVANKLIDWDKVQSEASETSLKGSDFSIEVGKASQQYKASQDVLKAISTLLAVNNIQNGLNSGQQTYIARNIAGISTQMTALQGQMRIISEQTTVLEMLAANQLQQQGQIAQHLDSSNAREEFDDIMSTYAGFVSQKNFFVPGYMSQSVSPGAFQGQSGGQTP
jgi:hypothetical protein